MICEGEKRRKKKMRMKRRNGQKNKKYIKINEWETANEKRKLKNGRRKEGRKEIGK